MSPLLDLQQQINADEKDPTLRQDAQPKNSNAASLAVAASNVEFDVECLNKERECLEVIQQDVDRTMQEFDLFTHEKFKLNFRNMLYLWSKDNKEYGYRQGMNEILGMITYAFFMEALNEGEPQHQTINFDK